MVKPLGSSGPRTKQRVDRQTYLTHGSVLANHFQKFRNVEWPLLHIDKIALITFQKNQIEDKNIYSAKITLTDNKII